MKLEEVDWLQQTKLFTIAEIMFITALGKRNIENIYRNKIK
jgi:hypothetical protein